MNVENLIENAFKDGVGVRLDGNSIALDGPQQGLAKWQQRFEQNERRVVAHLQEIDRQESGTITKKPRPIGKVERELKAKAKLLCMDDVQSRPISWLWNGRFAAGRITMIVGMPGCGKSFVTCDMAARVSTGSPWPDGSPCERGNVLFITAEDDPGDTIRPRLDAHGAETKRIFIIQGKLLPNDDGSEDEVTFSLQDVVLIERAIEQIGNVRLIVVDPIGSFMGGSVDSHRDNEVRNVLAPLAKLAEQSGAAVVMVAHRRKGNAGSADDTALGSRAYVALSRSVWHLSKDIDDQDRRLFLNGKNNLAKEQSGLAFRITDGRVDWESSPVAMTADDQMAQERSIPDGEPTSALDDAVTWLSQALELGSMTVKEIQAKAKADGITERTLRRAAEKIGVVKSRLGYQQPVQWALPKDGQTDHTWPNNSILGQQKTLANNGDLGQLWDNGPL